MSSFFLKIFALIFMIIDHTGFIIFQNNLIFRAIGRLAFPLFAYQMAVGFSHTKNKPKHILKLLLFAIISQIPYSIMINLYNVTPTLNIIFTFVIALLIIYTIDMLKPINLTNKKINIKNSFISLLLCSLLIWLGIFLKVDYTWYGILLTVAFYFSLNKKYASLIMLFILINLNYLINQNLMSALAYISLFDAIFILLFNGKKGYKISWIFYAIYLIHLLPLLFIKECLLP